MYRQQLLTLLVDDDVVAVGQRTQRHVGTLADLNTPLSALLERIAIPIATRQRNGKRICGAVTVKIDRFVSAHIFITTGRGLTLAGTGKSLYSAVWQTVDRRTRPGCAVLAIAQTRTTLARGQAEIATARAYGSPPDTVLHPIVSTDDTLHHIVQLIVGRHVAVGLDVRVEVGVMVEVARQLVRISFVHVRFHVVIPLRRPVVVTGIAGADADPLKERVFLYQLGHGFEVGLCTLVAGCYVRFVEGCDRDHFQTIVLHIFQCGLDDLVPCFGVMCIDFRIDVNRVGIEKKPIGMSERDMAKAILQII